jgi:microcystin-dependent protein
MGSGHTLGERGGESAHTLSVSEIPQHLHFLNASSAEGNSATPTPATPPGATTVLASPLNQSYDTPSSSAAVAMDAASVTSVGGSQAHLNMQPFLVLSFCIALQGIFPSQT